jgi:formylglycine-generating enzyme required for sulfatase activity
MDFRKTRVYLEKVGAALPTSAQWTAAALGDERRTYPWGDQAPGPEYANLGNVYGGFSPVTATLLSASPFGIRDLLGNVEELCADSWDSDSYLSEKSYASVRGGHFKSDPETITAHSSDSWRYTRDQRPWLGFRACVNLPTPP